MKTYKILTCIFLMTSLFTQACQKDDDSQDTPVPPSPEEEVPASQFDYVYSQGVDGYEVYRIPAIVKRRVIPYWHLQRLEKLEVMETVEI